jgi:signal transduction histidine kinase
MTLSRKIVLRNLALVVGLMLLAGASFYGTLGLRRGVEVAVDEYSEMRLIQQATVGVSAARALILAGAPDTRLELQAELGSAIDHLKQYVALQQYADEGSADHEDDELRTSAHAIAQLQELLDTLPIPDPADPLLGHRDRHAETLERILRQLNRLAVDADELIDRTQRHTGRKIRSATLMLGGLFAGILVVAVWVSVAQYRAIMRPLTRLRHTTRSIARGRFDERVPRTGDREFVEVAEDFNSMAEELQGLYENLEEKVAEKSRELVRSERLASVGFLAAGVAHEINNPLSIISGYCELSLKRLRRSADAAAVEDAEKTLEIIRTEAFRCKEITDKLLSLSKPGSATREPLSIAHAVQDVVAILKGHKQYRDRELILDEQARDEGAGMNGDCEPKVNANEPEIRQVLLNLLVNALESVEPGTGRVRVATARDNGHVRVTVADNGCGMAPETLEHVFEPFFSVRRGGDRAGMGLGLSITHAIIDAHGGRIRAESDGPGKGSRFVVELPVATAVGSPAGTQGAA